MTGDEPVWRDPRESPGISLDNVRGEWSLVTMAWNIKRIFALQAAI